MKCEHCRGEVRKVRRLPFKTNKSAKDYKFYRCEQCGIAFPWPREEMSVNVPRLIRKEKIQWKCAVPESFPCFLCRRGKGEVRVSFKVGVMVQNVVLCVGCANLNVEEIAAGFVGG